MMDALRSIFYAFLSLLLLFFVSSPAIYADTLDQNNLNSIYNDTVWYSASAGYCGGGGVAILTGSDNVQKAFNYLTGGLKAIQASAVIGNLEQESGQGLNPLAQQNGSSSPNPIPNVGFGIAQWTDSSRQQGLVSLAQQEGGKPGDLAVQLDYLWQELNGGYRQVLGHLKSSVSIDDAVNQFVGPNDTSGNPVPPTYEDQRTGGYENPGTPNMQNRLQFANDVLNLYGGEAGGNGGDGGGCVAANCNGSSVQAGLSQVRQNVVCIAQQELALWKSQPGYGNPYPSFSYAQTGYLKYTNNDCSGPPCEEWCADFASWVYNQASYPFSGGLDGGWRIAGVSSIQGLGEQNGSFHWHPAGSYTPQPGDLAIRGGNHVNIYVSSSGGQLQFIGGDQGQGPYPGGSIVSLDTYTDDITGYVSPD